MCGSDMVAKAAANASRTGLPLENFAEVENRIETLAEKLQAGR